MVQLLVRAVRALLSLLAPQVYDRDTYSHKKWNHQQFEGKLEVWRAVTVELACLVTPQTKWPGAVNFVFVSQMVQNTFKKSQNGQNLIIVHALVVGLPVNRKASSMAPYTR